MLLHLDYQLKSKLVRKTPNATVCETVLQLTTFNL